ncbi:MAG: phosphoribosyltransferase [Candidatus Omnitrophica bacterium]|nr:phosphoribosyltransferase [Candidatus Omnitrophota bacterium]
MGQWNVLSEIDTPFEDRIEAGLLLAEELKSYKNKNVVVLGIPRGGLIPAREIARALDGDLDIVLSHKLGAPANPELAIGAVVEGGKVFLDEELLSQVAEDSEFILEEKARQLTVINQRAKSYRALLPKVPLTGRIVIVTDDGVARGLTMKAALWAARHEKPQKLIAAIPVAPKDNIKKLLPFADYILCLRAPAEFYSIGQFYRKFDQVSDVEVMKILSEEAERKKHHEHKRNR